ncbi:DAD family-domain-containing protein, partial [Sphaerosporella brunnea]
MSKSRPAASAGAASNSNNPLTILSALPARYLQTTPSRTKLIDAFLLFLIFTGAIQFLYCVLAGNYPFNAFLAGFTATVGTVRVDGWVSPNL